MLVHRATPDNVSRCRTVTVVIALLAIHAGMLAYSATTHSPTYLEPAFLASGISHWQFGRFELYRVNPPLARMVAALPVLATGCETDWRRFHERPGSRAEFHIGDDFIKANGPASVPLFFYARWACIPFNITGAFCAYRWAHELYGSGAGLVTLCLYVFEPNLLAHGELITPDGACIAFGILAGYTFWRWLKRPTWAHAIVAGGALGFAELSKMVWLILYALWPLSWLTWRLLERPAPTGRDQATGSVTACSRQPPTCRSHAHASQLVTILVIAAYLLNMGYAFDGFATPLKDFQFVSTLLTGLDTAGVPGNRFRSTCLGSLPVPLPKQYVLGLDSQKKDLEQFDEKSFLRGEWKHGGWWYYYVYGLLVKVPCGTWGLLALVVLSRLLRGNDPVPLRDEIILLTPAVVLLVLVSSQTEFNIHLRYVFPSLAITLIFLGQAGYCFSSSRFPLGRRAAAALIGYSVLSACLTYPNHLAYFNDFVGGPRNGSQHLLGSSLDWAQGIQEAIAWIEEHEPRSTVELAMWSDTLAAVLLDRPPLTRATPASTAACGYRLVLYSADRYSARKCASSSRGNQPPEAEEEEIVKRFPSGTTLVRIRKPGGLSRERL